MAIRDCSALALFALLIVIAGQSATTVQADDPPKAQVVDEAKSEKIDPEKLVGTWEYISMLKSGVEAPAGSLREPVTITKEAITYRIPFGEFTQTYHIISETNPAEVELVTTKSPFGASDMRMKAKFEFRDDVLTICYLFDPTFSGKDPGFPEKMESTAENKANLIKLKRKP
jgi:uncharacterized protein (TIGR03067 family)